MDMARVWPIVCQFGVGAALCALGLWAGISSGYLSLQRKDDRRIVGLVIAGYLGLLALSCAFTFWLPFLGGKAVQ
jgi:hypothetical protein